MAPPSSRGKASRHSSMRQKGHDGGTTQSGGVTSQPPRPHASENKNGQPSSDANTVYHHQIYDILVQRAAQVFPGSYRHRPASGIRQGDVTAFVPEQASWGGDPEHWPRELLLWEAPHPRPDPLYAITSMTYGGRIVLDYAGNEVRDFHNLPLAISSQVEKWRMEAWMRQDSRMRVPDIVARLRTENRGGTMRPIETVRALQSRMTRFRDRAGLLCWQPRPNAITDAKKAHLDSLRTPQQRANNLSVGRNLTEVEWNQLREVGVDSRNYKNQGASHEKYVAKIRSRAKGQSTPSSAVVPSSQGAPRPPVESNTSDQRNDGDYEATADLQSSPSESEVEEESATEFVSGPNSEDDEDEERVTDWDDCSDIEDPEDSRNDIPRNSQRREEIRLALHSPIREFRRITGQKPRISDDRSNYASQWGELQHQLHRYWLDHQKQGDVPKLPGRDRWSGGIGNFIFADRI